MPRTHGDRKEQEFVQINLQFMVFMVFSQNHCHRDVSQRTYKCKQTTHSRVTAEKGTKMNCEIKAKADESLKQNSTSELNPDELEKVNGGELSEYLHGLCLAADGIRDQFGMDVAVEWIKNYVVQSRECVEWFQDGGGEYMFSRLELREESQRWWKDWC